jgi:hypothetical protein
MSLVIPGGSYIHTTSMKTKTDSLKQYVELRKALLAEKTKLESRLAQINEALGSQQQPEAPVNKESSAPSATEQSAPSGTRSRVRNSISLRTAAIQVTKAEPLSKAQILAAVKKLGYKFGVSDPIPSLNTVLYTKPKFKNVDGKFSPPE